MMFIYESIRPIKWLFRGVCLALPFSPLCAQTLTEQQAVDLSLSQHSFQQVLASQEREAQANHLLTKAWLAPEFEVSHESVKDERETSIWIKQQFDIAGKRTLRQQASNTEISATQSAIEAAQGIRKATTRQYFYQMLYLQIQNQLFEDWISKLLEVETTIKKRERAGEVSPYDRLRVGQQRQSLRALLRSNITEFETIKHQLTGLFSEYIDIDAVKGNLVTAPLPALEKLVQATDNIPTLSELKFLCEAAKFSSDAAKLNHIPDVTFGIGQKFISDRDQRDNGLLLSASVTIPLFDSNKSRKQLYSAKAANAESTYQLAKHEFINQLTATWHKVRQLKSSYDNYRKQSVTGAEALVHIAEAAYQADEISVLELIDAYQNALDIQNKSIDLLYQTRVSRLQLDAMIEGIQL
jgi:cobalt-zinc-cadmium efflux system outer membrane protein